MCAESDGLGQRYREANSVAATDDIARLCGHVHGERQVLAGGGDLRASVHTGRAADRDRACGYRRVQLVETSFLGQPAVDWIFEVMSGSVTVS